MVEKVMKFNDKFYLFYSQYQNDKEQLLVREIDFESGTFRSAGKQIISVDHKVSGTLVEVGPSLGKTIDKFNFYTSFDSSLLMVRYSVVPEKKREDESDGAIGIHVFDKDLNEKWSNKITMPAERKMYPLDYTVDAVGNVYMVARVYDGKGEDTELHRDHESGR